MTTQISRDGYRPAQRYSGVYQQQSRMLTDRDWNEMVDVLKGRIDDAFADALGTGAPRDRAFAVVASAQGPAFQPGTVWSGGVAARIDATAYAQQADFPAPPPLPGGQPYQLYVDVWERPVLASEDAGLRDAALTGTVDTATRTRAVAQVKWAPAGRDPEVPGDNPPRGTATLAVSVSASPAWPAGTPDNYLLRVEIHDAAWPQGGAPEAPSSVVVKWSRENGAQQYRYLDAPDGFKTGPWIWETWQSAAALHQGWTFGSWSPERGVLSTSFPALAGTDAADSFVRRWDGYCVLNLAGGAWSLPAAGSSGDPQTTAPGAALSIDSGALRALTGGLELVLDLTGKVFLAGDFWLVPVRRAVHGPGTQLAAGLLPAGIFHRYVTLAAVSAAGEVAVPQKRVSFPVIGRLAAADVDYDGGGCANGLFNATHDTVGKALDRLWQLGAEHLSFTKAADQSITKGRTVTQARQALDLLADVRAEHLAYEGSQAAPDAKSGLDTLFQRALHPTPWTTVGVGGQYPSLEDALGVLLGQGRLEVRLWLLPGSHTLTPADLSGGSARATRLTLAGPGAGRATRLEISQETAIRDCGAVVFQGLNIAFSTEARLSIAAGEVAFLDNWITGTASKDSLVHVGPAPRILFRNNVVDVTGEAAPGHFLTLDRPIPADPASLDGQPSQTTLESNDIRGFVSLYGYSGDNLTPDELHSAAMRIQSLLFDPASLQDVLIRNNRLSGLRVAGSRILQVRSGGPVLGPLYRRVTLAHNTFTEGYNQLLACAVSFRSNLFPGADFGWTMSEELLFTGNTANRGGSITTVRKDLAAAGNSSRIEILVP